MFRYLSSLSLSVFFVFLVSGPLSAQDGRVQHLQAEIQRHRAAIQDLKNQLKSIAPDYYNGNQASDNAVESSSTDQGETQGGIHHHQAAKDKMIQHHQTVKDKKIEHHQAVTDKKIHHDKVLKDKKIQHHQAVTDKKIHHDNVAKDHKIKHTKVVKHHQAVQKRNRNDNQGRRVGPGDGPGRRVGPNN